MESKNSVKKEGQEGQGTQGTQGTRFAVFRVSLWTSNEDVDAHPRDHVAKIIKWYKKYIPTTEGEGELNVKSISHSRDDLFQIIYTGCGSLVDDGTELHCFLDVDADGNNPITIRGVNYYVTGYLDD